MPFSYILANLVAETDGAVGALFLDETGETVDLTCTEGTDPENLRVIGAWLGIYLRELARFVPEVEESGAGLELVQVEHQGLHLFARALADGYYVALVQKAPAATAITRRRLSEAGELLQAELFAQT